MIPFDHDIIIHKYYLTPSHHEFLNRRSATTVPVDVVILGYDRPRTPAARRSALGALCWVKRHGNLIQSTSLEDDKIIFLVSFWNADCFFFVCVCVFFLFFFVT